MEDKTIKFILYIIIGLTVIGLALLIFFPGIIQAWTDANNFGNDKCSPAPGYTEESWKEHMGHHPDIYKECLN